MLETISGKKKSELNSLGNTMSHTSNAFLARIDPQGKFKNKNNLDGLFIALQVNEEPQIKINFNKNEQETKDLPKSVVTQNRQKRFN
jgi:hypothetical protein